MLQEWIKTKGREVKENTSKTIDVNIFANYQAKDTRTDEGLKLKLKKADHDNNLKITKNKNKET